MLLPCCAFAGMEDAVLRFSTPGPDHYADGSEVVDGECYALVWSPAGKVFAGFNADGSVASARDRLILAAPLARDGRCRDALFQIPAAEYAELAGGEWAVCLIDTRTANGVPAGVKGGVPRRVNRWGVVDTAVKVRPSGVAGVKGGASGASALTPRGSSAAGVCAHALSSVPASLLPPRITGIDVADGKVRLTVSGTVPYLTYTLASGATPNTLVTDEAADAVDGAEDEAIEIATEAQEQSRFFKVKRAE